MKYRKILTLAATAFLAATIASAQVANIALGNTSFDSSQPVEVTADSFSIDQSTGQANFDGNVLVVQGDVRLSADAIAVQYATDDHGKAAGIAKLMASGGVTFVTNSEAMEADTAEYAIESGNVTLVGDVLLTQGANAIAGDKLILNLSLGTGQMEGRVRTVFSSSGGN